jgi:hypothetical protein
MCIARWMTVYGAFTYISSQNVNHFIASDSKNRSAQNLFRFFIEADFDETLCLTFS